MENHAPKSKLEKAKGVAELVGHFNNVVALAMMLGGVVVAILGSRVSSAMAALLFFALSGIAAISLYWSKHSKLAVITGAVGLVGLAIGVSSILATSNQAKSSAADSILPTPLAAPTSPGRAVVAVAKFQGDTEDKYRVRDIVLTELRRSLQDFRLIEVRGLADSFGADQRIAARESALMQGADFLIWGWHGDSERGEAPISVAFENLGNNVEEKTLPEWLGLGTCIGGVRYADLASSEFHEGLVADLRAMSLYAAGLTLRTLRLLDAAEKAFVESSQTETNCWPAASRAWIFFALGRTYDLMGASDRSITAYEDALRLDPENGLALANLGGAWGTLGDHEKALSYLRQAVLLTPTNAEVRANFGSALVLTGNVSAGEEQLTAAIDRDPNLPLAYFARGSARFILYGGSTNMETLQSTISDLSRAIEIGLPPGNRVLAYALRAQLHLQAREADQAMNDAKEALRLDSLWGEGHVVVGDALAMSGRLDEAISEFKKANETKTTTTPEEIALRIAKLQAMVDLQKQGIRVIVVPDQALDMSGARNGNDEGHP